MFFFIFWGGFSSLSIQLGRRHGAADNLKVGVVGGGDCVGLSCAVILFLAWGGQQRLLSRGVFHNLHNVTNARPAPLQGSVC